MKKLILFLLLLLTSKSHAMRFLDISAADHAVQEGAHPSRQATVALVDSETSETVTATFIAPQTLITCAHHTIDLKNAIVVTAPEFKVYEPSDYQKLPHYKVSEIIKHPDYRQEACGLVSVNPFELPAIVQDVDKMLAERQVVAKGARFKEYGPDLAIVKIKEEANFIEFPRLESGLPAVEPLKVEGWSYGVRGLADGSDLDPLGRLVRQIGNTEVRYSRAHNLLYSTHFSIAAHENRFLPSEDAHPLEFITAERDSGQSLFEMGSRSVVGIASKTRGFNFDRNALARQLLGKIPSAAIKECLEKLFVELPMYNVWTPVAPYMEWITAHL